MQRAAVVSSNISDVGHEADTLFIKFHSGVCYSYAGVAHTYYDLIKCAESVGKFFHREIKNRFPYKRLTNDPFA